MTMKGPRMYRHFAIGLASGTARERLTKNHHESWPLHILRRHHQNAVAEPNGMQRIDLLQYIDFEERTSSAALRIRNIRVLKTPHSSGIGRSQKKDLPADVVERRGDTRIATTGDAT